MKERLRERAEQLAKRQEATSQLAYAVSAGFFTPEDAASDDFGKIAAAQREAASQAMARAQALAPSHPDLAWLAASYCADGNDCDRAQRALLEAEPDNAAAWLRAVVWALRRGDESAAAQMFQRATRATRYDTHRGVAMLALLEGYAGLPLPPVCNASEAQAEGRKWLNDDGAVFDIPAYIAILGYASEPMDFSGVELRKQCLPERGESFLPERHAACTRLFTMMANGDTLLEQIFATRLLAELSRGAQGGTHWRERYRQLRWLMEQIRTGGTPAPLAAQMATSEVAAMEEALRRQGRWSPPADWLPEGESERSLILTGQSSEGQRK